MPILRGNCSCGELLVVYVSPSQLYGNMPVLTTQDLKNLDAQEDAERVIREVAAPGRGPILDAQGERYCPACGRKLRFAYRPGLLLRGPVRVFTCSNCFRNAVLALAREHGADTRGIDALVGLDLCDRGHGERVDEHQARALADCLEAALPEVPVPELQSGGIQDPRQMLSGRFRFDLIDLIQFLREGGFEILTDTEALTVVPLHEVAALAQAVLSKIGGGDPDAARSLRLDDRRLHGHADQLVPVTASQEKHLLLDHLVKVEEQADGSLVAIYSGTPSWRVQRMGHAGLHEHRDVGGGTSKPTGLGSSIRADRMASLIQHGDRFLSRRTC